MDKAHFPINVEEAANLFLFNPMHGIAMVTETRPVNHLRNDTGNISEMVDGSGVSHHCYTKHGIEEDDVGGLLDNYRERASFMVNPGMFVQCGMIIVIHRSLATRPIGTSLVLSLLLISQTASE